MKKSELLKLKRKMVESSRMVSIGYDEASKTLVIEFKANKIYSYKPITPEGFNKLLHSESKGQFFQQNILNNERIKCTKISK